ncbi:MAG: glycine cleavage system protein H [Syntrophobacteraceae bacterium]|jgi:glycine cleavage system H lipoate-binding protein
MDAGDRKRKEVPVVFSMPNEACIWSKAGVIESTPCINAFDCLGCSIEKSVRTAFEDKDAACGQAESGTRNMSWFMSNGKCRHVLSGRIAYGLCSSQSCANCPVEQMIEDSSDLPGPRRAQDVSVSGYHMARNYYYHRGHTWARVEYGGLVRVGLDDFALRLLGHQDAIEVPAPGSTLRQGQPAGILKRCGRQAAIISPVDGVVAAVNHNVLGKALIANDAPYEDGWLMVIRPSNLQENLNNLFFDSEGLSWIDEQAMQLNSLLAEESRLSLVAPGTEPASDVVKEAPEIGWERLVQEFME